MTIWKLSSGHLEYILKWNIIKAQSSSQCWEADSVKGKNNTKHLSFRRNREHVKEWSCLYWFFCATIFFLHLPLPIKINNYFQGEKKEEKERTHKKQLKREWALSDLKQLISMPLEGETHRLSLSCKYTACFWVIILKWQLKTTPSQNKLLSTLVVSLVGFPPL